MTISSIANWFTQAVPTPTNKSKCVQLGVHFEEVAEMCAAIGEGGMSAELDACATHYKTTGPELYEFADAYVNRTELLDALCDQIVTAVGVAHMYGLDIQGALVEVNRSNFSKFVDGKPVFDANGKIAKPSTYSKPDLSPFVGLPKE